MQNGLNFAITGMSLEEPEATINVSSATGRRMMNYAKVC